MYESWKTGFVPSSISDIPQWLNQTVRGVFYGLTTTVYSKTSNTNTLSNIFFWFSVFGLFAIFLRYKFEFAAITVFFIVVFAMATKIYPIGVPAGILGSRLALYILPVIIFLTAHGICYILDIWCMSQHKFQLFITIFVFTVGLVGAIQTDVYYFKNRIHKDDSFQMYKMISENYHPDSDLIVVYRHAEPSFKYWKIFNNSSLPYVSIPSGGDAITANSDLGKLIGKNNYENKKRIYFIFSARDINPDVISFFNKLKPSREFEWNGTRLYVLVAHRSVTLRSYVKQMHTENMLE